MHAVQINTMFSLFMNAAVSVLFIGMIKWKNSWLTDRCPKQSDISCAVLINKKSNAAMIAAQTDKIILFLLNLSIQYPSFRKVANFGFRNHSVKNSRKQSGTDGLFSFGYLQEFPHNASCLPDLR